MGVAVSCLLTFVALMLCAAAMARHQRLSLRRGLTARSVLALRLVGVALLLAAPAPWMMERGATMGIIAWLFCALPLVGLFVSAVFTMLAARPEARIAKSPD